MTWMDHLRRAVSVVLVALSLIVVPAVASATFSGRQVASLKVGTDRMETPSGVTGTWRCTKGPAHEAFSFTTTGFVDSGPAGGTYVYSISREGAVVRTETSASKTVTVTSPHQPKDNVTTAWTVSIQTKLGSWTGTAYTQTINCTNENNLSGQL